MFDQKECIFCFEPLNTYSYKTDISYNTNNTDTKDPHTNNKTDTNTYTDTYTYTNTYTDTYTKNTILYDLDTRINEYQHKLLFILNKTLVINCYHEFHYGCFLKYTRIKCYNRKRDLEFFIDCPLCRYRLNLEEMRGIIIKNNNLFDNIRKEIFVDIKTLQRKIFFYKTKLYCKKFLSIKNDIREVFLYHQLIDSLEEFEFLDNKIKYILKQ